MNHHRLYQYREMKWVDVDFPANDSSLQQPGHDDGAVSWKRTHEICPNACLRGKNVSLPAQGRLGDCWLIAAFYALTKSDEAWGKVFGSCGIQSGKITVNLWDRGLWKPYVIDDFLPVRKTGDRWTLLNASNVTEREFWAALLEKACAKKYGCYGNLISGQPSEGYLLITGGYTWIDRFPRTPAQHNDLQSKAKSLLQTSTADSVFLSCDTPVDDTREVTNAQTLHCYNVVLRKTDRTLRLWDPLSRVQGDVFDSNAFNELDHESGTVTYATNCLGRAFATGGNNWRAKILRDEWTLSSSGGFVGNSAYCDNPQYIVCVAPSSDFTVLHMTLIQSSKRYCVERKHLLQAVGVHVFYLPSSPPRKLIEQQINGLKRVASTRSYEYSQNVKILFFAKSKELVGEPEGIVQIPKTTTRSEVLQILKDHYPRLEELGDCFTLSLNEEYFPDDSGATLQLSDRDEIAVIPPLSGG